MLMSPFAILYCLAGVVDLMVLDGAVQTLLQPLRKGLPRRCFHLPGSLLDLGEAGDGRGKG